MYKKTVLKNGTVIPLTILQLLEIFVFVFLNIQGKMFVFFTFYLYVFIFCIGAPNLHIKVNYNLFLCYFMCVMCSNSDNICSYKICSVKCYRYFDIVITYIPNGFFNGLN